MEKLLIIDGNAIMHRAYHAIPMLNNKKGEPTNAVYGFVSMLLSYLDQLKPTHLIVCFDEKEKTFRRKEYEAYQAKRPEMDEWLSTQITKTREWLKLAGVTILSKGGYEADDVIGTITAHALQLSRSADIVVVTGDRDIFQLINENVKVFTPTKGMGNGKLWDVDEVLHEFDFLPPQMVDYKALIGDSSDNYPGVAGIGPKTARDLIVKYHTVEEIYDHIEEIGGKVKERLEKGKKDAFFFKKLATIFKEVPIEFDFSKASNYDLGNAKSVEFLKKLGFKSILMRITKKPETSQLPLI